MGQDPVQVAPSVYRPQFENDRVRLLEGRMKPGEISSMHSHPANVTYALSDAKVKFTSPSGESDEVDLKAGKASWASSVALGDKEPLEKVLQFRTGCVGCH